MVQLKTYKAWFVTGSQHLYGEETLKRVAQDAAAIARGLDSSTRIPVNIVYKPVVTTPDSIAQVCRDANADKNCIGLITWMHTFSPAKMWIGGLMALRKPFVHLHTQFNREIPWSQIDMDFMNLNQSAHGGREFGFIATRLGRERKVIVGYWEDEEAQDELGVWIRAASAWQDSQCMRIARFGDNMREVAVTEGDKVEAQMRFGYSVNGYGLGDLAKKINEVGESETERLCGLYQEQYAIATGILQNEITARALHEAARIELGMRAFLEEGAFTAFTTTFEDLHGLPQLPGLAVQRLMKDGYGFGAEGDWKTAALVRSMKVMSSGLSGGTSFMEDYTYHFAGSRSMVLGAHMLEVCESVADRATLSLELHPLSIGGKGDPARLVFTVPKGPAVNASIVDMGNRFRLIVNEVTVVDPPHDLPKLPVARAVWIPQPDLRIAATSWILAGGAHHTGFSQAITAAHLEDFAEMADIEYVHIGADTTIPAIKKELRWSKSLWR